MLQQQPIELRKIRDFGQTINDSFTFLKENFKPLLSALLIICGFFILMEIISSVFTYAKLSSLFTTPVGNSVNPLTGMPSYTLGVFFDAIFALLTQLFINLVTLSYISVYVQKNKETPTVADVWGYFRYYFFRVIGSNFLMIILLVIGFVLCLIPGVYLWVPFSLIIPIIVVENASFGYAFNKSFRLIKDKWWFVFGIIIIMFLIVSTCNSLASIPLTIFSAGNIFLSVKDFALPLIIIFSIMKGVLMLLYTLPVIAIALCYFSLTEQKDGTGLMSRIENLGKTEENTPGLPTEEY